MKLTNKLYSAALALLGFSACNPFINITPDMYGPPVTPEYGVISAKYRIIGSVTADEKPVEGIKISILTVVQESPSTIESYDTDKEGKYVLNWSYADVTSLTLTLLVEDVDGEENGGDFATLTREISMADDTWNLTDGAMTAEINFGLVKKADDETDE